MLGKGSLVERERERGSSWLFVTEGLVGGAWGLHLSHGSKGLRSYTSRLPPPPSCPAYSPNAPRGSTAKSSQLRLTRKETGGPSCDRWGARGPRGGGTCCLFLSVPGQSEFAGLQPQPWPPYHVTPQRHSELRVLILLPGRGPLPATERTHRRIQHTAAPGRAGRRVFSPAPLPTGPGPLHVLRPHSRGRRQGCLG